MDNYSSSTKPEARDKVEQTLREEIAEGNYIITPTRPTIISALSAVPKAGSDELRLIHDCSMPVGKGVNSYVPSLDKLHFQTIDDAVSLWIRNFILPRLTYAMLIGQYPSTQVTMLLLALSGSFLVTLVLLFCTTHVFVLGEGGLLAYFIA